jgi:hypothetical protein
MESQLYVHPHLRFIFNQVTYQPTYAPAHGHVPTIRQAVVQSTPDCVISMIDHPADIQQPYLPRK